jgi:hypothetical protein
MLGFELSERTISRWMGRYLSRIGHDAGWHFLRTHRTVIAATDFFTVRRVRFKSSMGSSS